MPVQVSKKGIRVLGVSESFIKGLSKRSVLAGIVMRKDRIIDGFSVSYTTVGGRDATEGVLRLFYRLNRCDVNLLMLNGSVISWFNVINLNTLYTELEVPLICVTYEESEGLDEYFKRYFDDYKERIMIHRGNGERVKIKLHTGSEVFVNFLGIDKKDAKRILDGFTFYGAIPEPLKMSRMLAKALLDAEVIVT